MSNWAARSRSTYCSSRARRSIWITRQRRLRSATTLRRLGETSSSLPISTLALRPYSTTNTFTSTHGIRSSTGRLGRARGLPTIFPLCGCLTRRLRSGIPLRIMCATWAAPAASWMPRACLRWVRRSGTEPANAWYTTCTPWVGL